MTGTIDVVFGQKRRDMGDVGILGENICNVIRCDVTSVAEEDTTFVCACQRPDDPSVYTIPVTVSEDDDKTYATVELTSYELYRVGILNVEFRAIKTIGEATRVIKWNGYCDVLYGLFGESDEPGMPIRDALDRLDAEIARVQELAESLNNGSGNAGGGERFVVNIAYSGDMDDNSFDNEFSSSNLDGNITCDKTVAEIKAAYEAGKNVVAVITMTATGGVNEGFVLTKSVPLTRIETQSWDGGSYSFASFGDSWLTYFHGWEYDSGDYTSFERVCDAMVTDDIDVNGNAVVLVGNPFVEYKHE